MKLIAGIAVIALMTGCASAEQRMQSKENYRDAQVRAIEVQANAGVNRQQVRALERQAMWQALAEVVKANPDAASNVAIVAAVAAARTNADGESETTMMSIKTEQSDAQAWAKILAAPVLQTLTTVGVQALNADLQKELSRNQTRAVIAETEQDGKIYDMIGVIAQSKGEGGTTYNVSDNGVVNTGYQDNDQYGDSAIESGFDPEQASDDVPPPDPDDSTSEDDPGNFSLGDEPPTPDENCGYFCTDGGPITWVPGVGWVTDGGNGYAIEGEEEKARAQAYLDSQAEFRAQVGDWSAYSGSSLDGLKALIGHDRWWDARITLMANEVASGDDTWFWREFATHAYRDYALEAVNRYIALLNAGYTDEQITNYIYGGG